MDTSNQEITRLLRSVAAALMLKNGNRFQVRAYETAADAVEHLTSELKDLWQENKLDQVPGVGENLKQHLSELFKTGKVKHFETIKKGFDPIIFEMLDISGVGPRTALELSKLGVKSLGDLKGQIQSGSLVKKGFSAKIAQKIMNGLEELSGRTSRRMLLPYASAQADRILSYLKRAPGVVVADPLGSLRRKVATIGDLDFAAASENPEEVVRHFTRMPGISRVLDYGENKASVILHSGIQADLLVGKPESYGALLQHFTGSKHHNIKLRSLAQEKGYSLSEYGVKKVKSTKLKVQSQGIIPCKTEEDLYSLLGMDTPAPELREDGGEIEAALNNKLPQLVEIIDVKGDLHLHSSFPMIHPSHGPGVNSLLQIVERAIKLKYEYVGISDHPPGFSALSPEKVTEIIARRTRELEQLKSSYKKQIRVLNGLEIDILPNGTLSVPNEVLATLDYCIAGVHSLHRMPKDEMTQRLLKALESPYVDIIAHPTGRLLNERDSSGADWEEIFRVCSKNKKLLEINGFPNRLDLRDDLVRLALRYGVKFIINTDAHEVSQMGNMRFGVAVARRGWVEAKDIVNTWDWKKFADWFKI